MNEFQIPAWVTPYRDGQRTSAAQGAAAYMEYYSVDGSADDDNEIEERMVPHAPVLRPYASRTGTKATLAKMREMGWSLLVSASGAHRTENFSEWALDNGAWSSYLQGKPFDAVVARAMDAGFDERISLVSLLLAGLNTRFAAARAAGAVTDACYQQLRSFKRALGQQAGADPADLFAEQRDRYRERLEADKSAGSLLPDEAAARTRTVALLTAWGRQLDNGLDPDDAFDTVRSGFNSQVQRREEAVSAAANALEFAFDFMEQAFEDGQEMVVFVNELALGPDSAPFLAENDCERFEQYSQKLLLQGGEDELLAELQRDDVRAGEHSAEF